MMPGPLALVPLLHGVVMVGDHAADGGAGEGVVGGEVAGDAADDGASHAALGVGSSGAGGESKEGGGGKGEGGAHVSSWAWRRLGLCFAARFDPKTGFHFSERALIHR
jgi:hypothetical protein